MTYGITTTPLRIDITASSLICVRRSCMASLLCHRVTEFLHGIGDGLKIIFGRQQDGGLLPEGEETHETPRLQVSGEARRVGRHACRCLTQRSSALCHRPAAEPRNLACGGFSSFGRPITSSLQNSDTGQRRRFCLLRPSYTARRIF